MNHKVLHIDTLASVCGYFTSQTDWNNGYGCNHPEQGEREVCYLDKDGYTHRDDKQPQIVQGKCYAFSCPIAPECDLQDLKEYGPEWYSDYKDTPNPDCLDADLIAYHYEDGDEIGRKL